MNDPRSPGGDSREASPPSGPADPEERAREICLAALERRRHSRRELELKLRRKGVSTDVASRVLDRLAEVGLVDDLAYARAFVESRQRRRPKGARGLRAELAARGIDAGTAERTLEELGDEEPPEEAARRALLPKLRALAKTPRPDARRKAADFLLRRGFDYDVTRRAVDEALPAREEEDPA